MNATAGELRGSESTAEGTRAPLVAGTDGSASAQETVRQAAELAAGTGTVLHLVGAHGPGGEDRAAGVLAAASRELGESGLSIVRHTRQAAPAEALCDVAREVGAGLIVVGNREADAPGARSISEQVQAGSPCSVLVVDTEPYWHVVPEAALAEPRRPRIGHEWKVLLISTLAVFMALLDVTIVNIAFPAIHASFRGTSLGDLSWVLNAYNVVVAALLVPAGRLADRLGRRRVFFGGLGVFLLGSVLCGAAPDAGVLIAARALQAIGAATLIPASFGIVLAEWPVARRHTATSIWAAAGAVAAAAGPSLGGVLVQSTSWRWVFFVNLILALGLLPGLRILRESREEDLDAIPDLIGGAMVAAGIGALALGIVKAPDWGWGDRRVIGLWVIALVLVARILGRSRRHPSPVLETELLRIRSALVANVSFFAFSMGFFALLLGNILFLTDVWGYSVLRAGFGVTPGPLMAAVAAAAGGRLVERVGTRTVTLPGLVGFGVACLVYRGVGPVPHYLSEWLPAQILSGASIGLTFAGLTTASVMDLPPNRVATGTAIQSLFRQVGAVLGIALLIAIIGTPTPATAMHAFESSWLFMAVCATVAALIAGALPRHRPGEAPAVAPLRRRRPVVQVPGLDRREISVHGHRVIVRVAGSGPALLLVHGLLEDSLTWRRLAPALALNHTVIAPDLLGHGESEGPLRVDYSLGAHAQVLRDVLDELGHAGPVDVVGHSLGGSIAMDFAGHYPERVRSLTLIAPGGFGRELHPGLRLIAMPGAGPLLRVACGPILRGAVALVSRSLRRAGLRGPARGARELLRILQGLSDAGGRSAFMRSVRSVIDVGGQSASALDRLELLDSFPLLVIWGTRDRVIPPAHAKVIAEGCPRSELVLLDGIGHLPHISQPAYVAGRIATFLGAPEDALAREGRAAGLAGGSKTSLAEAGERPLVTV